MWAGNSAPSMRKSRGGYTFLIVLSLWLALNLPTRADPAPPNVWGCLLYASNSPAPVQTPGRLNRYDKKLEQETGFSSLQTLGENQTQFAAGRSGVLTFPGDLRITVTSISRGPDGKILVGLELFRGEKQLLLTQAKLNQGSPLFIRGPAWRQGELIIAVVVGS
jgi:hypothetical protein